jgi:hypothetical protein
MESQQIMELLLSMQARMDANQEKADADRTTDREQMLAEIRADRTTHQEQMLAEIRADRKANQEKADANRQADRELLIGIMDANAKSIRQEIKCAQAKIRSTVNAFKEKMDASIANRKIDRKETTACQCAVETSLKTIKPNSGEEEAVVEQQEIPNEEAAFHSLRTCLSETAASQEDTETEPDPGKMQSVEEHQEIPKEEAAVMLVGEPRKRRRVQNLAAERRQKRKERTQGNCGSRRKSAAACKKITRCATVAWRKRILLRKIVTQGIYGPRKRLTVTGRKMTSCATVAWYSENVVRKDCARDQAKRGRPKRRKDDERLEITGMQQLNKEPRC